MTGRGIDQILPHPSKPGLYEEYARSAMEYVEMAEEANGPIPRPVDFAYIWGDAARVLDRYSPAARIINLETSITASDVPACKGINYRMSPGNTPCLTAVKIDCCVLANNHVLDWERAGLRETLFSLNDAGIGTAGAGLSSAKAAQPCIVEIQPSSRVLVFAFATPDSGTPRDWAATDRDCGICLLPDLSEATAASLTKHIREWKLPGDVGVVSLHWGGNWGYGVPQDQQTFAHRLIDGGAADVIHGHSSHHRKGFEVYRSKLVLYGCGDFLNDYEGIGGYEEFRSHLTLMYFPTVDRFSGRLVGLELVPMEIHRFRLREALRGDVQWLADVLSREGAQFGSTTTLHEGGRLKVDWTR